MSSLLSAYTDIYLTTTLSHLSTLADGTRSRLLFVLEREELTVGELVAVLQLPQSTISRHLRVLSDDGWVTSRADGTSRYYRKTEPAAERAGRVWEVVREELSQEPGTRKDLERVAEAVSARRRRAHEYFSGVAGQWDQVRSELFGEGLDQQLLLSLLDPSWIVGDLGCGSGRVAALLAPHVRKVIAVDASPEMLTQARTRLLGVTNVELHQSELEHLPLADAVMDVALCSLVLAYTPEPQGVLGEVHRTLRPGGRLVIVDLTAHDDDEMRQGMGQVWRGFSSEQLSGWLEGAGFADTRIRALPHDPRARAPALQVVTAQRRGG